ncbi:hypothetical protein WMY93_031661 [Mugilogobius chulae]|uniref:Myb-like domain-containing protein n=1 Tax=Mugilogobius chulae TaxID=88201 RepID=A0AAW0MFH5_9GOBI
MFNCFGIVYDQRKERRRRERKREERAETERRREGGKLGCERGDEREKAALALTLARGDTHRQSAAENLSSGHKLARCSPHAASIFCPHDLRRSQSILGKRTAPAGESEREAAGRRNSSLTAVTAIRRSSSLTPAAASQQQFYRDGKAGAEKEGRQEERKEERERSGEERREQEERRERSREERRERSRGGKREEQGGERGAGEQEEAGERERSRRRERERSRRRRQVVPRILPAHEFVVQQLLSESKTKPNFSQALPLTVTTWCSEPIGEPLVPRSDLTLVVQDEQQTSSNMDEKLVRLVKELGTNNWDLVCQHFKEQRSELDCQRRWNQVKNPELVKGPWTYEEDQKERKTVSRTWHNHLNPTVNKSSWTLEEDHVICHAHRLLGNRWLTSPSCCQGGETDNSIKNHWNSTLKRKVDRHGFLRTQTHSSLSSSSSSASSSSPGSKRSRECAFSVTKPLTEISGLKVECTVPMRSGLSLLPKFMCSCYMTPVELREKIRALWMSAPQTPTPLRTLPQAPPTEQVSSAPCAQTCQSKLQQLRKREGEEEKKKKRQEIKRREKGEKVRERKVRKKIKRGRERIGGVEGEEERETNRLDREDKNPQTEHSSQQSTGSSSEVVGVSLLVDSDSAPVPDSAPVSGSAPESCEELGCFPLDMGQVEVWWCQPPVGRQHSPECPGFRLRPLSWVESCRW